PSELATRAFDRFVRGPGSAGSGLGLAIVRDIARAHGGTAQLESEPGIGTMVRLRLPAEHSG
ncbi:MAG TPA: ATP-binding protein, partial [Candidatus Dormibacteraeota bacterium]